MDHYCPWLGKTIGNNNYRYFHILLLYSIIISLYLICLFIKSLVQTYYDITYPWGFLYITFLGLILAIVVSISASVLYILHWYLITKNVTMIEWLKYEDLNRWNTGSVVQNITQVYPRKNFLAWFLPIGSPAHDGLYFITGKQLKS